MTFSARKKRERELARAQRPSIKGLLISLFASASAVILLLFASLSFTGTAVGLVTSAPLFLLFSPVLVPAGITTTLLASGFMAGGASGAQALAILMMLYKRITGKDPPKIPGLTPAGGATPAAGAAPAAKPTSKPAAEAAPAPAAGATPAAETKPTKKPKA